MIWIYPCTARALYFHYHCIFKEIMTNPSKYKRNFQLLKWSLVAYLVLFMVIELLLMHYISKEYEKELFSRNLNQIWVREFWKTTKHFFIFSLLLMVLYIFLGLSSTITENVEIFFTFMLIATFEWILEVVGSISSHDYDLIKYKLISQIPKPVLILFSIYYYKEMRVYHQKCGFNGN